MITYQRATQENITELAKLRRMVLTETNKATDPYEISEYERINLVYLNESIPSGEFIAWIALDGDKIVATSGIVFYCIAPCKSSPNGKVGYVQNMYTLKKYRRRGIAKVLFDKTMEEAKQNGCTKVMLNATDEGRALYEAFGFNDVVNEMVYYLK